MANQPMLVAMLSNGWDSKIDGIAKVITKDHQISLFFVFCFMVSSVIDDDN